MWCAADELCFSSPFYFYFALLLTICGMAGELEAISVAFELHAQGNLFSQLMFAPVCPKETVPVV